MHFSREKPRHNRPDPAIALRAILPSLISIALLGFLVFAILFPALRATVVNQKKEYIRQLTESAWNIMDFYGKLEKAGGIGTREAQDSAQRIIGGMRFGKDSRDYFWIQDMTPKMLLHPYRPDLVGEDISGIEDSHGLPLFGQMARLVQKQGEGFYNYHWQYKDDPLSVAPKLSYVKGYAPWGWIVGTGVYQEDLTREVDQVTGQLIWWSLGILGFAFLLMFFVIRRNLASESRRLASEIALEESFEKYRFLTENMKDVVYALDVNSMRLVYVSPSIEAMLGHSVEEVMKSPPFAHKIQESQKIFADSMARAMKWAELNPGVSFSETMVLSELHKNGSVVDLEVNAVLTYDGDLKPDLVVGALRNITARVRAEQAVKDSEERFRAMTENSADVTLVLDRNLTPQYVSPSVKFFWMGPRAGHGPKLQRHYSSR